MTEIFCGPWRLIVRQADPFPKFGFRVSGSGNANGIYEADSSPPWDLMVQGAEWTVELLFIPVNGNAWQTSEPVKRTMGIVDPQGLTVTLDSHWHHGMTLDCISQDPTINPPMRPNPYNFTILAGG